MRKKSHAMSAVKCTVKMHENEIEAVTWETNIIKIKWPE